jgi:hypothetical protein
VSGAISHTNISNDFASVWQTLMARVVDSAANVQMLKKIRIPEIAITV